MPAGKDLTGSQGHRPTRQRLEPRPAAPVDSGLSFQLALRRRPTWYQAADLFRIRQASGTENSAERFEEKMISIYTFA